MNCRATKVHMIHFPQRCEKQPVVLLFSLSQLFKYVLVSLEKVEMCHSMPGQIYHGLYLEKKIIIFLVEVCFKQLWSSCCESYRRVACWVTSTESQDSNSNLISKGCVDRNTCFSYVSLFPNQFGMRKLCCLVELNIQVNTE